MTYIAKSLISKARDPNGTRTRVFAVKGETPTKSTPRPAFPDPFRPLLINGLRSRGDARRDSGGRASREDPRSGAEAEGRQNGAAEERQSPNLNSLPPSLARGERGVG